MIVEVHYDMAGTITVDRYDRIESAQILPGGRARVVTDGEHILYGRVYRIRRPRTQEGEGS